MKKLTEWKKGIIKKNDSWSKVMHDYKQNIYKEFERISKERVKCIITNMVNKHHLMLRTVSTKGVLSKNENVDGDSDIEKLLRNMYSQINRKKTKHNKNLPLDQ